MEDYLKISTKTESPVYGPKKRPLSMLSSLTPDPPTDNGLIEELLNQVQFSRSLSCPPPAHHSSARPLPPIEERLTITTNSQGRNYAGLSTEQWFACYFQFRKMNEKVTRTTDPRHQCTNACGFVVFMECVFICRRSGNMHICTNESCTRIIDTTDHHVCELTGIAYPFQISLNPMQDDGQEYFFQKKRLRAPAKGPQKTTNQILKDVEIKKEYNSVKESKADGEKLTVTERKDIRHKMGMVRKELIISTYELQAEALVLIKRMFPGLMEKKEHLDDMAGLAAKIVNWWGIIQRNLQKDTSEKSEYKFLYHTLACLYEIKSGPLKSNQTVVIPFIQWVCDNLIEQKCISRILNSGGNNNVFTCKKLTKTGKLLCKHLSTPDTN